MTAPHTRLQIALGFLAYWLWCAIYPRRFAYNNPVADFLLPWAGIWGFRTPGDTPRMSTPVYWTRFMFAGVRMIWPGGGLTFLEACRAIHNEYQNASDWKIKDENEPEYDVAECLTYWEADE